MTQDPEDALAQEAVEGRARLRLLPPIDVQLNADQSRPEFPSKGRIAKVVRVGKVVPLPREIPFGDDPIPPDAQHLGG